MANYRYTAEIYDYGRDMFGNPTSHYTVWDHREGKIVARSGKRREQIGYTSEGVEHAIHALWTATGKWTTAKTLRGDRSGGSKTVGLKIQRVGVTS